MTQTTPTCEQKFAVEVLDAWRTNPAIRAEFPTIGCYAAFTEATNKGLVKLSSKGAKQ